MTLARSLDALRFVNSFASLPPAFYTRLTPQPVRRPRLVHADAETARRIGLDPTVLQTPGFVDAFAGNTPLPGGDPLAAVYSGHQFGVWAGQLGDGRALLLGEVAGPGGSFELQLKGSGMTPYSRMGDGRAVLRSSVREYLASIAMRGLGIPTTDALCLIAADDPVRRETLETAAVVTRVAPSFVRFGSFEHWAAKGDTGNLRVLADYVIEHDYPECGVAGDEPGAPYVRLLHAVLRRTARLMAQWQSVGFMHGVMNTDNMSILGLTLDYGPYGFMDGFDANHICNHTDTGGRYAWNTQPMVGHWNLYRLAEALRPLAGAAEPLRQALDTYEAEFLAAFMPAMNAKLGLAERLPEDGELIDALWQLMHAQRADFTQTFRRLAYLDAPDSPLEPLHALFTDTAALDAWLERYRARLAREARPAEARRAAMLQVNPLYVLRNHLAEEAIQAARNDDFSVIARLAETLRDPYTAQEGAEDLAALPPAWACDLSVSCSS
ncbi:YdiU family protein [Verticiella sediminum]|uniref:Protein nucleotidyltransferase YdiU n=1 Tax=Verticiella sediminum TaxID=1247510 RepID=A0A556AYB2_9BURK|nr:YdiU family protein [Verticiella sediminum]TSH97455.1 YdiU family protein [Verticiella sediminum]